MFYRITDKLTEIEATEFDAQYLTAGYISREELISCGESFGFSKSTIQSCQTVSTHFRSGVEVYDEYTFTELRIADIINTDRYDCVALYVAKNLIIVVDVKDSDFSTRNKFMSAVRKFPASTLTLEKILAAFLDALTANDTRFLEERGNEIAELEGDVLKDNTDNDFSLDLLALKKDMLVIHNYYEQLIDITEALEENENNIFDSEDLMYISNIANKIVRLREDVDSLSSTINHLQDAYSSSLDLKLNHTMKVFTVLTSIFFPLTIITGWYGMNFHHMPELAWRYGYVYVIALSVVVVAVLMLIGKKKKWY